MGRGLTGAEIANLQNPAADDLLNCLVLRGESLSAPVRLAAAHDGIAFDGEFYNRANFRITLPPLSRNVSSGGGTLTVSNAPSGDPPRRTLPPILNAGIRDLSVEIIVLQRNRDTDDLAEIWRTKMTCDGISLNDNTATLRLSYRRLLAAPAVRFRFSPTTTPGLFQ